jgi:hypothetical protein
MTVKKELIDLTIVDGRPENSTYQVTSKSNSVSCPDQACHENVRICQLRTIAMKVDLYGKILGLATRINNKMIETAVIDVTVAAVTEIRSI